MALNENLDKRAFNAAFRNATNSVLVAAKRCAFRSKSNRDRGSPTTAQQSFDVSTHGFHKLQRHLDFAVVQDSSRWLSNVRASFSMGLSRCQWSWSNQLWR
jgi:hypothetical protein